MESREYAKSLQDDHVKDSALSMADARGTIGFIAPEVFYTFIEGLELCQLSQTFTAME